MSALAQAAAIERGVGLLPLQIRRHQEELRRWRQLENHASPAYPRSGGSSGTKNVAAVQRARAASAAPRLESQELQALVMERRELLARQRSQSREHNRRVLQATRALQPAEAEYAYSSGEDLATGGQVADSLVSSGEDDPGGQSSGHPSGPAPRQRSPARRGDGSRQALELQEKMQQLQVEPQTRRAVLGRATATALASLGGPLPASAARDEPPSRPRPSWLPRCGREAWLHSPVARALDTQAELAAMRELRTQAVDEASEWRHAAHLSASAATAASQLSAPHLHAEARAEVPRAEVPRAEDARSDGAPQLSPQWQQGQRRQWQPPPPPPPPPPQWQQQQQQQQQQGAFAATPPRSPHSPHSPHSPQSPEGACRTAPRRSPEAHAPHPAPHPAPPSASSSRSATQRSATRAVVLVEPSPSPPPSSSRAGGGGGGSLSMGGLHRSAATPLDEEARMALRGAVARRAAAAQEQERQPGGDTHGVRSSTQRASCPPSGLREYG